MGIDKVGLKLTKWELTKWDLTKWEVDQMGIDEVGIDKVGIDEVGRYPPSEHEQAWLKTEECRAQGRAKGGKVCWEGISLA